MSLKGVALFSGGLDSLLALHLILEQGCRVDALCLSTPFFEKRLEEGRALFREYPVRFTHLDITDRFIDILVAPRYGYGKHLNPCIDCKILMLSEAKGHMERTDADFVFTGEVLGQRPMSQRRDTLNVIERDSATRSQLLRPLSAKLMNPTEAELRGWVDRDRLLDFSGRGRSRQIALAKSFGITDFPAPAGGCILADPILSTRISRVYRDEFVVTQQNMNLADILLMLIGRQFLLPNRGWLVLGRDEKENDRLEELQEPGDIKLFIEERPGPVALLRRAADFYGDAQSRAEDLDSAAGLITRYAKKRDGVPCGGTVVISADDTRTESHFEPLADDTFRAWII